MKDKLLTALYAVAVFFLIITFSISLPIYCRFFYYLQIESLGVIEKTGYDTATIREAYDEVLDYLTIPGAAFGTGVFKHSDAGASHFADCKMLFDLNTAVLLVSFVTVLVLLILHKKRVLKLSRPFGMNANFLSAAAALMAFVILGILIAVDFETAFETFHHLFFPGKDNWQFSSRKDPIIKILPEEFFVSCAILIIAALVCICLGIITVQLTKLLKKLHKNRKEQLA